MPNIFTSTQTNNTVLSVFRNSLLHEANKQRAATKLTDWSKMITLNIALSRLEPYLHSVLPRPIAAIVVRYLFALYCLSDLRLYMTQNERTIADAEDRRALLEEQERFHHYSVY